MPGNYATRRDALVEYGGSATLLRNLTRGPVRPQNQLFSYVTNGAEANIGVANGSVTPVVYKHTVEDEQVDLIERFTITLVDNVQVPTKFGGLSELTNGVLVQALDQDGVTVIRDYCAGRPIKINAHFGNLAGVDNPITAASGDDALQVRWTISAAGGSLMLLSGESFRVIVRDNFAGITEFVWMVQGRTFTEQQVLDAINAG